MGLVGGAGYMLLENSFTAAGDRVAAAEQGQKGLVPLLEHRPGLGVVGELRVLRRGGHEGGEQSRADLEAARREGRVVGGYCLITQGRGATCLDDAANREPGAEAGKGAPDQKGLGNRVSPGGQPAIAQYRTGKALRAVGQHAQADQRAPVLTKQGGVLQLDRLHPGAHPLHMVAVRVVSRVRGFVGAAKADQVRRQHAVTGGDQHRDHLAVQVRPGGLAVHQQHRRRVEWALVDVGHAQAAQLQVVRGVGKVGQAGKALFWRAQHPVLVDAGEWGGHGVAQNSLRLLLSVPPAGSENSMPSSPTVIGPL